MYFTPLALAKSAFDFQSNQNGLFDPKQNENIICAMMKYRETFNGRHMALNTNCSE